MSMSVVAIVDDKIMETGTDEVATKVLPVASKVHIPSPFSTFVSKLDMFTWMPEV